MRLFHVTKEDYHGKYNASYIIKAASPEAALIEVELDPTSIEEMNKDEGFKRYKVSIEEINLEDRAFYRLD